MAALNLRSNRGVFIAAMPFVIGASSVLLLLDEAAASTVSNVFTSALAIIGAVLLLSLYWMNRRTSFRDIGFGLAGFMILLASGWTTWAVYSEVIGEVPSPSVADLMWLAAYFLLIWLMFSHARESGLRSSAGVLAATAAYWAVMAVLLALAIAPTIPSEDLTVAEKVVYNLYPVADALMLNLLGILVWLHQKGQLEDLWLFLTISAFFWMAGDFLYLGAQASGAYSEGSLPDFFYLCTYGLLDIGFGILVARRIRYTSVVPRAEVDEPAELTDSLKPRSTYIIWDQTPEKAYKLFAVNLHTGLEGLVVSRKAPGVIKQEYKLERTPVFWLSTIAGTDSVYPGNLGILTDMITRFLDKGSNTIVLLDGFESIVVYSEFRKALLMIDQLKDVVAAHEARLVIPIDPRTLSEKERSLVSKNATVLGLPSSAA